MYTNRTVSLASSFAEKAGDYLRDRLTAIDLFSGCGGLSLGLRRAGFHVLAGIEKDGLAAATYARNHTDVWLINEDIRNVSPRDVRRTLKLKRNQLSLLAACPPCQGFSRIRTRNKSTARDPRNDLVLEVVRFADEFRPSTILLENVPGLLRNVRITVLENALARRGYNIHKGVFDAADFGVPQRRKRMILVATRIGGFEFPPPTSRKKTVREVIRGLPSPHHSTDPLHNYRENRSTKVMRRIRAVPKDGGGRESFNKALQLKCHDQTDGFRDVYGRLRWGDVTSTITSGCINPSKGRFLHPSQNRAITLREAALLQTFPKGYKFLLNAGRYAVAEMIGNALPPEFVRRHALSIADHLQHLG